VERQANILRLSVVDDGEGCDLRLIQRGNGLKNMNARAETMGGKISIESSPGKGTRVILTAKMA
jgi:signal transduction histidine kinase